MIGDDDPRLQRERIIRLAAEVFPNCRVVFDADQPPSWLRFRIDAPPPVSTILGVSGHFHASEIADKSDDELRALLRAISPSFAPG
jgi:hypothetical protein